MPNKSDQNPDQNADFMGGPSFHPMTQTPIRSRRLGATGIAIPANGANDEPNMLFDGTQAVSDDLYDQNEVIDARPARPTH